VRGTASRKPLKNVGVKIIGTSTSKWVVLRDAK
jgi:hypothetical protein